MSRIATPTPGARRACSCGGRLRTAERRQHLACVCLEEALLVGADLLDVELVEARLLELADLLEVRGEVGPARDRFGDLLLGDELRGLFEVGGGGEDLRELAGQR